MDKGKLDKKRIVLKIGTNTLTKESDSISRGKIEDIGKQIVQLQDKYEFIIVTSGAIAAAKQFVNLESELDEIVLKQALSSIGQPQLMRVYQEVFKDLGLLTSQCLISYADFEREKAKQNIINTVNVLTQNNFIPVINENDTVAVKEIQFGDNDNLAAQSASLLGADILIIATNTDGICTKESVEDQTFKTITEVDNVSALRNEISVSKSTLGTGGMASKIDAAEIAQTAGIETWVVNGIKDNFILNAMEGNVKFTKISASVKVG